ncbi:MAG: lamin tail domain-containing protein [Owenweeksia sp.]|nr:lamin tail domain-containing protein [Owenweeksia sp.]
MATYQFWTEIPPADCNGNVGALDTLLFALPSLPQAGELIINELLFNPPSGGADFVEIYNHSDKYFDLSNLRLGNWDKFLQVGEFGGIVWGELFN